MPKYVLILHEAPNVLGDVSPEQIQAVIADYGAWSGRVRGAGQMLLGEKLTDEGGRNLATRDGRLRVVDGPYAEAKEVIAGLFVIEARDYAEAVEIASGCPHLRFGRIELREVEPTG